MLKMHNMSNSLYQKIHNDLIKYTEDAALEAMEMAGKEEARLAIEENNVNEDEIPLVTVVADGTWSKRSYKSKGCLTFIPSRDVYPYHSKKILFIIIIITLQVSLPTCKLPFRRYSVRILIFVQKCLNAISVYPYSLGKIV